MSPRGACGGVPDGTCSAPGTFWVLGGGTSSAGGISSGGSTSPLLSFTTSSLNGSVPGNSLDGSGLGEAASSALLGGTSPSPGETLIGSVRGDSPASVLEGAPPGGP